MSGKPSLKAEIYEAVLSDIIQGIYKQNEIITEKQLIAKYGVSKSPIRDALIELCKRVSSESMPSALLGVFGGG